MIFEKLHAMQVAYILRVERQTDRTTSGPTIKLWSRAVNLLHCTFHYFLRLTQTVLITLVIGRKSVNRFLTARQVTRDG